ncbi:DNA polymerase [Lysobacter arseniciresistens ZS79]|uniref:DNA polymerase n=1 Tax=Lysobacter arseniciresistens ZS79 TaxID=913325 RepID=A0A0A0F529_9GAMM|nr:Y-family DNA polymerase [Lysobacter arseniciresistens]KGM57473.1 DNA polymerase [Lysobacter arseniciresistens ZS79]
MFGLVDANSFYCSVEQVFDPALRGKAVVVGSNNDGCAIARSDQAKKLGVKMGQPLHEIPPHIRRQLHIRSANFGLYGDISGRVVGILRDLFPKVEVYSIDESFVEFPVGNRMEVAHEARSRIERWVGIPNCVGIGPTKTLAKMANKIAKAGAGIVDLADEGVRAAHLARFPVEDVWGVGRKFAARLGAEGIITAGDLVKADSETLRARYGVVLARTQAELQGVACSDLQEAEPDRQQIVCSRSFGREVVELEDVQQAVATFAINACEKLRKRSLQAGGVWVWLNTNPFKPDAPQYHPSKAMSLISASADTREVLRMAQALTRAMYRKGYRYKKAGVGLLDLTAGDSHQGDLFSGVDPRSAKLMEVLDAANRKFGRNAMSFASSAWREKTKPQWSMNQQHLSPAYTQKWSELLRVR